MKFKDHAKKRSPKWSQETYEFNEKIHDKLYTMLSNDNLIDHKIKNESKIRLYAYRINYALDNPENVAVILFNEIKTELNLHNKKFNPVFLIDSTPGFSAMLKYMVE